MGDSPFLIAGGGIAGLAAALALAKAGRDCIVLERAPAFQEAGAGLQVSPNAVRALQWLGAWGAVEPHCHSPHRIVIRDSANARELQRIPLGAAFEKRFGAPYRVALRAGLLDGLLTAARASDRIQLRTSAEIVSASTKEASLTLSSGEKLHGQAVVGADGVHSAVRACLDGKGPRGSHHTVFRQLRADSVAEDVTLWLCPGGHVVEYPVTGSRLNLVASVEHAGDVPVPQLPSAGEALSERLKGEWSQWPVLERDALRPWRKDACLLLGDAAHASLPFLAQGAAMALEDACMLGRVVIRGAELADVARERMPRAARMQAAARRMGRIYHASGALRLARNAALRAMGEVRFREQLAWVYDWKPE